MLFASQTSINTARTDNGQFQVLCKTARRPSLSALPLFSQQTPTEPQTVQVMAMSCPENVKFCDLSDVLLSACEHKALVWKVHARLRLLRLVIERLPQHFTPYKAAPKYQLTYYVEKLECGHERLYFPQAGPLAKRRHCGVCAAAASLPPKKPCSEIVTEARHAAKRS